MANTGCQFFKRGIQNWKDFCLKINIPIGNDWILRIGKVASCQKLGIILEKKVISKLMLSKNVNNKKCAPKLIFFNEKKNWEWFGRFLTYKNDFESQNFAVYDLRF